MPMKAVTESEFAITCGSIVMLTVAVELYAPSQSEIMYWNEP